MRFFYPPLPASPAITVPYQCTVMVCLVPKRLL